MIQLHFQRVHVRTRTKCSQAFKMNRFSLACLQSLIYFYVRRVELC